MDTDSDVRILRRIERDMKEQYFQTAKLMHEGFVEGSKKYADVILQGVRDNQAAIELLMARIAK